MIISNAPDPGSGPGKPATEGKRGGGRRFSGYFGVFVAVLVLTAGCAATSGTLSPAGSESSISANVTATATASTTQLQAPDSPSIPPASPVAVRTTHVIATQVYTPAAAPAPTTHAPQPVQTIVRAQSCYPLTNGGKCYSPGEYCRDDDHGTSGIDAEGDAIVCEDNGGWRWERG